MDRITGTALRLIHGHRKLVASFIYASITVLAYVGATLLRYEFQPDAEAIRLMLATLPALIVVRVAVSFPFRLGAGRWRFVAARDLLRLILGITAGSGLLFAFSWGTPLVEKVPRAIVLIEWVLSGYLTAGVWILYRLGFEGLRHRRAAPATNKRALVVGAGEAGQMLVHEMRRYPTGYEPIGFIDDDPLKWGTTAHGIEVIGSTEDLGAIVDVLQPDEIVIAVPSATTADLRRIVGRCEETPTAFKILPGIREVVQGDVAPNYLREVRVEDLLGREPIQLELPELAHDLSGKVVIITGAAGSIGCELARQVALHEPRALILADQAETPLYYLDMELREAHPDVRIVPRIMDVAEPAMVELLFEEYRPDRVFHAAAYKHVPLMESHVTQAVRNNVVGTWRVAEAAGRYGAERFVLVSTDKAVNPVSVMGATKRLAELVTLHMQAQWPSTTFGAVRFGNVLGSSGSVIPVFRRQLEAGKPLTVTHEAATRYFMTIPEAVQLILQASLLPAFKGHVAMLEMGEPVRIVDLARNLLRLSGRPFRLGETVIFTGLRPGEKLHEELAAGDEEQVGTSLDRVTILRWSNVGLTLDGRLPSGVTRAMGAGDLPEVLDYLYRCFPTLEGAAPAEPSVRSAGV